MPPETLLISDFNIARLPLPIRTTLIEQLLLITDATINQKPCPKRIPLLSVHFCLYKNSIGYDLLCHQLKP